MRLKQLGFEVFLSKDLDQAHFASALTEYLDALNGAAVGLFYFAGHGIQINGQNFLLSTNATGENEFMIPSEGMELASVIAKIEQRAPVALVFVDACRNNPLADRLLNQNPVSARTLGLTRGLARLDQLGHNTLVAYATAPNQTAADGMGIHSPFTNALLTHIDTPGLEVSAMLKRVARDVLDSTANQQQPEVVASMTEEFYFNLAEAASTENVVPEIGGADQRRIAAETAFAFAEKLNTVEAYRFFLDAYSDTSLAEAASVAIAALEEEARNRPQIEINSAFPNVANPGGTAVEEAALNLTVEDRKGIQIILSTLGYDTHGIDGQFGSGTRSAIKAFQLALDHEPTGYLSRAEYDYIAGEPGTGARDVGRQGDAHHGRRPAARRRSAPDQGRRIAKELSDQVRLLRRQPLRGCREFGQMGPGASAWRKKPVAISRSSLRAVKTSTSSA